MSTNPLPVVVVGAGLAGLVAAHLLRRAGERVEVYERTAQPGGRVRTHRDGEWITEEGPHLYSGTSTEFHALCDELGVARREARAGADRRYLVYEGRLVSVPASTGEMLATPLLTVGGRLRLLREPFIAAGDASDESVAEFVRRRMGEEFSSRFVEPVVAASYAGEATELLARFAFLESVQHEARAGSILKGRMRVARTARREGRRPLPAWSASTGADELPIRLAAALGDALHYRSEVTRVTAGDAGWEIEVNGAERHAARGVVITASAPAIGAGLLRGLPPALNLAPLAELPHAHSVTVSLGFRRDDVAHPLDGFGVTVPRDAALPFHECIFASSLFPDRAPAGHHLLTFHLGGGDEREVRRQTCDELVDLLRPAVATLFGATAPPTYAVCAERAALIPQPVRGHDRFLAAAAAVEAACPGVVFAGRWHDGIREASLIAGGGGRRPPPPPAARRHGSGLNPRGGASFSVRPPFSAAIPAFASIH